MVGPHGAGTRRGGGPLRRGLALRRTESNDIVEFIGPREAIGRFVNVKIERALNWALFGSLA